jgi:uncharacterized integral membrane protein
VRQQEPRGTIPPRVIVGGVVVVLFLVFIAENSKKTKIRFLIPEVVAPLWMGLTAAGLLGVLAGGLVVHLLADHRESRESGRRRDREDPPTSA